MMFRMRVNCMHEGNIWKAITSAFVQRTGLRSYVPVQGGNRSDRPIAESPSHGVNRLQDEWREGRRMTSDWVALMKQLLVYNPLEMSLPDSISYRPNRHQHTLHPSDLVLHSFH